MDLNKILINIKEGLSKRYGGLPTSGVLELTQNMKLGWVGWQRLFIVY